MHTYRLSDKTIALVVGMQGGCKFAKVKPICGFADNPLYIPNSYDLKVPLVFVVPFFLFLSMKRRLMVVDD